jgi:hypothetical protein
MKGYLPEQRLLMTSNLLTGLCAQRFFHAYPGYEFAHIRGTEADLARMSGVRPTHILGRSSLHVIAMQMVSDFPCRVLYADFLYPACSRPAKRGKCTDIVELPAIQDSRRAREPPPCGWKDEPPCPRRGFLGGCESMTGTAEVHPFSIRSSTADRRP